MSHEIKRKLMVVEDEFLIATGLEYALEAAGYAVLGPFARVEEGLEALDDQYHPDLALLDVNLAGRHVYPLADALASRHVPFVFLTGCNGDDLPPRFAGTPVLVKPFSTGRLLKTIEETLSTVGVGVGEA